MTETPDAVVELDLGCSPEAAVSGALLLQDEYSAFLMFNAVRAGPDGLRRPAGTAVVELRGCRLTRFGYPNDDALAGHPLYGKGLVTYGIYEVLNSSWLARLRARYRGVPPDDRWFTWRFPSAGNRQVRHYAFVFHDSALECLAEGLELTLSREPHPTILQRLAERLVQRDECDE